MSLREVCEAWADDLTSHVSGLAEVKVHLYAPWSRELLAAAQGERHLAVYPSGEPEVATGLTTEPADLLLQVFTILVWEDAADEASRLYDDDDGNGAWLDLFEQVRGRLYVMTNTSLGVTSGATRYTGAADPFGIVGTVRFMTLNFNVTSPESYV